MSRLLLVATRAAATTLMAAIALAAPALAAKPAFDCAKASGDVEELICKDDGLAALDQKLATLHKEAQKKLAKGDAAAQREAERLWIDKRNACAKTKDVRACVDTAYRKRIIELQATQGKLEAPKLARYVCKGHESTTFFAAFYNDTDPPCAVLTYGDDQVLTFIAPSGSGARYSGEGVDLWEHQGEATVQWKGTELKCTVKQIPLGGTNE